METVHNLARYILYYFRLHRMPIDHRVLQKMLYCIQGWHLAFIGTPLFQDDFEAWPEGPVIPVIRRDYDTLQATLTETVSISYLEDDLMALIDELLYSYASESNWRDHWTVGLERPWMITRIGLRSDETSCPIIPKTAIAQHFKALY